jgi:hypothetical protein
VTLSRASGGFKPATNPFQALGVVFPPADETDNPSGMPAARLTANASRLRRETLQRALAH